MRVAFAYSLGKDVENFIKGASSTNSRKPTSLMRQFLQEPTHDLSEQTVGSFVQRFIRGKLIDIALRRDIMTKEWSSIEADFISRSDALFGIRSDFWPLTGYLSTNSRCTYQIEESQFFVYMLAEAPLADALHELFHFYTWYAFRRRLTDWGIDDGAYNDFKEALTVLLNVEYVDLMRGVRDRGYEQHAKLREEIRALWLENRSLASIVNMLFAPQAPRQEPVQTIQ